MCRDPGPRQETTWQILVCVFHLFAIPKAAFEREQVYPNPISSPIEEVLAARVGDVVQP